MFFASGKMMNSKNIQYFRLCDDDVTEAFVLACIVFCSILFGIVPNIAYLSIASYNIKDDCFEDDSNLVTWLIVESSVVLLILMLFLGLICLNFNGKSDCVFHSTSDNLRDIYAVELSVIFLMLITFFHIVWCPIGAFRLNDDRCKTENPILYVTTLIAVIMGFLQIVFHGIFYFWYTKNR